MSDNMTPSLWAEKKTRSEQFALRQPLEEALTEPYRPHTTVAFRLPAICSSLWTVEDLARWKKLKELKEKGGDYEQLMLADLAARPGGPGYA